MEATSLRVSLNGMTNRQVNRLFNRLSKSKAEFTLSRASLPTTAISQKDLIINGKFSYELLQELSDVFPSPLSISYDISRYPELGDELKRYAAMQWQLKELALLGNTIFPVDTMIKMLHLDGNDQLLKLLLMTPAVSEVKSFLITKPKGMLSISEGTLSIFLPLKRSDFIYLWLSKVCSGEDVDFNWISGSSEELPDKYTVAVGIESSYERNLERYKRMITKHNLDDYQMVYKKAIGILGLI